MADAPYLVALALVDKGGLRALPLAGKSQSAAAAQAQDPGEDGHTLALELLLRLWQGSDELPLRRAAGEPSLLLVELPLELMSEHPDCPTHLSCDSHGTASRWFWRSRGGKSIRVNHGSFCRLCTPRLGMQ
ncbi:MAG: hypothetical protein NTV57_13190, partial [Cyanobacteria bacterium]|nr:hypothetical protein [Cyanobacteriota bacterium]